MLFGLRVTIVAKRNGVVDKIDGKRIVVKAYDVTDYLVGS